MADWKDLSRGRPPDASHGLDARGNSGQVEKNGMEAQVGGKGIESFGEDVTCPICHSLIVGATSLHCAHLFCSTCVSQWLKRHSTCPVCRSEVPAMHEPVTLLAVDSLVSKMIALVPLAARADFEERKAQLSADLHQDRKHCSELTAKISKVDKNKFLFIGQEWTGQQRNDFREGTNYYKSKARAVYCQSAGLHRSFIETAQVSELVTALKNLALVSPSAPTSSLPANKARQMLWLFLSYGFEGQQDG